MNLVNQLAERARRHPERLAFIEKGTQITYQDLYTEVCSSSQFLLNEGFQRNSCILILQPISIQLYIQLLAVLHAGMHVMFIDPSAGNTTMQNSLQQHPPDGFIGVAKAHLLKLSLPQIRKIKKTYYTSAWFPRSKKWNPSPTKNSTGNHIDPEEVRADTPALITFTSGSTGIPKAACRSHRFLLAQHAALSESLHFKEGEIDLITLPIFAIANLASGMTSVIADTDLRYPAKANSAILSEQCKEHNVTRCAASPAFYHKLFQDKLLPVFHTIYTGGAPVFPHIIDEMQAHHPDLNIVTVYGSTEAEPISHITWDDVSPSDHEAMKNGKGLLVGKPVSATKVMIHEKREDKIGQIAVTGDHVLKGYLNGEGDEGTKLKIDGEIWHLTGDMGYFDQENRLWLMGRESAIFEVDKRIIYPFGIECSVMHHSAVNRCAVIQHESRNLLCLELEINMLDSVKNKFSQYDYLEFIQLNSIPMDKRHNAKVDYPSLIKMIDKSIR